MRFSMMMGRIALLLSPISVFALAACGSGAGPSSDIHAKLEATKPRSARVALTPALDVSTLYDNSLADRVVVDDIQVNLADARLLGADPRIPAGGLGLLKASQVIWADGSQAAIQLPFPTELANTDGLAVYVRLDKASELKGSSVVVHIRVYEGKPNAEGKPLTAQPEPDGDPAHQSGTSSPEPDGDPAHKHCSPEPDGDPARCNITGHSNEYLSAGSERYVRVELRGADVPDLVATLSARSAFDVVIGIPAWHWLNESTMQMIDAALANVASDSTSMTGNSMPTPENAPIVVGPAANADPTATSQPPDKSDPNSSGYALVEIPNASRLKLYRY